MEQRSLRSRAVFWDGHENNWFLFTYYSDVIKSRQFNIGPVAVTILQGDITKEKTDVVVNSTIEELNLATGIKWHSRYLEKVFETQQTKAI